VGGGACEFAGGTQIPEETGGDDDGEEHQNHESQAYIGFHAGK